MSDKSEKWFESFDPSGVGAINGKIFGLPCNYEDAGLVILPVPWDVTASYGAGSSNGPESILKASPQLDLYCSWAPEAWKDGIFMLDISDEWKRKGQFLRAKANELIRLQEFGADVSDHVHLEEVNTAGYDLNEWVFQQSQNVLLQNKLVLVLGGDHSTPLGLMQALNLREKPFSILQIDAHADLRDSYEGFTFSHASIMHHALKLEHLEKLVSVGIRDISKGEVDLVNGSEGRVIHYSMEQLDRERFNGKTVSQQFDEIIDQLGDSVYVSLDIDGLDPSLCPGTGTPVPGGLQFGEISALLEKLAASGKSIIGADLCEVAPSSNDNEWNGNVGARILYLLAMAMLKAKRRS